jgi:hypothetical protein
MSSYQQTVPGQMCLFWFDSCIAATGEDAEAQFNCIKTRDARCGNDTIDASGSDSTSSSASPSGTDSPSGTSGSGSEASPTSSGSSSSPAASSQAAAASFSTYGTPVLAGGLLALFGLAL